MEPLGCSEHAQVLLTLEITKAVQNHTEKNINFFFFFFLSIENILVNINWKFSLSQFHEVDEKIQWLNNLLLALFEQYAPKFRTRRRRFLPKRLRETGNRLRLIYHRIKKGKVAP